MNFSLKKGEKKKTVSVSTQEWACFILSAASWLQGMNAWPLSWTFRLKKDPFHWFKSNSCFAYLSTKSSFKKFDSRNSNISRSSSPSKSEHAFYMTETLELLTFFYIILLKKLPRNGTFFLVGGNCFPLLKYYRAGSCAPHAHMSKQQHKNQLKLLIMVLVYDSEWRIYSFTLNILSKVVF